jgi:hypothetical protein
LRPVAVRIGPSAARTLSGVTHLLLNMFVSASQRTPRLSCSRGVTSQSSWMYAPNWTLLSSMPGSPEPQRANAGAVRLAFTS